MSAAAQARPERALFDERACRVCGCTDSAACEGGCAWTDIEGVCSACAGGVLAEVLEERRRQDEKWGEQNYPDGTGALTQPLVPATSRHPAGYLATIFKGETFIAAENDTLTWTHIFLEEVFEALAESDPSKLRTELIQVAAVAAQWVEAIDRRPRPAVGVTE